MVSLAPAYVRVSAPSSSTTTPEANEVPSSLLSIADPTHLQERRREGHTMGLALVLARTRGLALVLARTRGLALVLVRT